MEMNIFQYLEAKHDNAMSQLCVAAEQISFDETIAIMKADYKYYAASDMTVRLTESKYIKANALGMYVTSNVWLAIARDLLKSDDCVQTLRAHLIARGLVETALLNKKLLDAIRQTLEADPDMSTKWGMLQVEAPNALYQQFLIDAASANADIGDIFQVLSYLTRFTPIGVENVPISSFIASNKNCKATARRFAGLTHSEWETYVVPVKEIVESILSDDLINDVLQDEPCNARGFYHTSGSAQGVGKNLAEKLKDFAFTQPYLYSGMYPLVAPQRFAPHDRVRWAGIRELVYVQRGITYRSTYTPVNPGALPWNCNSVISLPNKHARGDHKLIGDVTPVNVGLLTPSTVSAYAVKPTAVPKDLRGFRLIAPERAYVLSVLTHLRHKIEARCTEVFGDRLPYQDQGINQAVAYEGSVSGKTATGDLSSASDNMTRNVVFELASSAFVEYVRPFLAKKAKLPSGDMDLFMFATSGNPLTWICEAIVILAICEAATHYVEALYSNEDCEPFQQPTAYGDDWTVDTRVYDTACDWLEWFGFVVNRNKSYGPGTLYRESCGVEYFMGYEVTSKYSPRHEFSEKPDAKAYTDFIELQHKVYGVSSKANRFLEFLVLAFWPKTTTSVPGSIYQDIWGSLLVKPVVDVPRGIYHGALVDVAPAAYREYHTTVCPRLKVHAKYDPNLDMLAYTTFLRLGPSVDQIVGSVVITKSRLEEVYTTSDEDDMYISNRYY